VNPDDPTWKKYEELIKDYTDRGGWANKYKHLEDTYYEFGWGEDGKQGKHYTYDIARELKESWADYDIDDIVEAQEGSKLGTRPPNLTIFQVGDLVRFNAHNVYDDAEQLVKENRGFIGLIIEIEDNSEAPDTMALIIDGTHNQHRWILLNDLELANE
jgi:putative salt-induced outer membrane protein YdiY